MNKELAMASQISPRERQLLRFASEGMTDQRIAAALGISVATVGTYWGRIRMKYGPFSRTELVARFVQEIAGHTVDELKTKNSDLLQKIHDLVDRVEALRALLAACKSVIDDANEGVLIVNHDGVIELANATAANILGYEDQELHGIRINDLIPERLRQLHDAHRKVYFSHPTEKQMGEHLATPALKKDGSEVSIAAFLRYSEGAAGTLVTCLIRVVGVLPQSNS